MLGRNTIMLRGIFYEELRRAFSWKRFLLVLGLSFIVFAIGYRSVDWIPPERSFIDLWYALYNQSYFIQLMPLMAAFPFADSLVTDKAQGYINQLLARCSYRRVLQAKLVSNALSGAVAVTLPLLILYGLVNFLLPRTQYPLNHPALEQYAVRPYEGLLRAVYLQNPDGFIFMVIGLVFLMGATYATFGLSISLLVNNRFLAIGFPFVLFTFTQYFADRTRLLDWYWSPLSSLLTYPWGHLIQEINEIPFIFFNPIIVLGTSLAIFLLFSHRNHVLESGGIQTRLREIQRIDWALPNLLQSLIPGRRPQFMQRINPTWPWRNYLRIQIQMNLRRSRWLLVFPVVAAMAIIFSKVLLRDQGPLTLASQITETGNARALINVWDVFFATFGNAYTMGFVIANLFLVLISDLQPETGYGQLALFRLRSRVENWSAKIIALFSLAGVYVLVSTVTLIGVAAFQMPIELNWSLLAQRYGEGINLPALLPRQVGVFTALAIVISLVILGLSCLGLLAMLINSLTQRRLAGYLFVEVLLLSSIGLSTMLVNGPHWQMVLPIIRNLILPMFPFLGRGYPIWLSFAVWLVWLGIILPVGFWTTRHQDYFAHSDL